MTDRANFLGFNHVALEVGDVEEALQFYDRIFKVKLRGCSPRMAFIGTGDQFLALFEGRSQGPDAHRHVGLVVDDREAVRRALEDTDVETKRNVPGGGLDFLDLWGNYWQIIEYGDIQFTKAPEVLEGMGLDDFTKFENALDELRAKGMAPDQARRPAQRPEPHRPDRTAPRRAAPPFSYPDSG